MKRILFFVLYSFLFSFGAMQCSAKTDIEKTFGMIKPSGMDKINEIKSIIKSYGLKIVKSKKIIMTEDKFDKLYNMHKEKQFFNELKQSMVGKEVEIMIISGENAVERYRDVIIDIRSMYSISKTENVIHGSDTLKDADYEICLFFKCKN